MDRWPGFSKRREPGSLADVSCLQPANNRRGLGLTEPRGDGWIICVYGQIVTIQKRICPLLVALRGPHTANPAACPLDQAH